MPTSPLGWAARRRGRPLGATASAACLLAAAAAACAPTLTDLGRRVEVVLSLPPGDCRVIGEADGRGTSRARAESDLRNAAGRLHANRVVVGEVVEDDGHVRLHGQAFGCRVPSP